MTPAVYGYHPCVRCRCLRPASALTTDGGEQSGTPVYACTDSAVCSRLAGVGAVNEISVLAAMGESTPLELALAEVTR